jgi:probable F420-dependent oxidoreductase
VRLGVTAFLTDQGIAPAALAAAAEERGYSSLWLPHHSHLPVRAEVPPGLVEGVDLDDYKRGLDPLIGLAFAAEATKYLRLGTGVLLVAQLDAISTAKQIATLDHLANGRVVLGVGTGWNRAEAEDHGLDFGERRAVLREHVECMQAIWRDDVAEYRGRHVRLPPAWSWPKPAARRVPILLGGAATDAVFSAVCAFGDGWMPIGGAGLAEAMPRLATMAREAGRDPASLEVVPFGSVPTEGKLAHFAELGVSEVVLRLRNGAPGDVLRQLDDYAAFVTRFSS